MLKLAGQVIETREEDGGDLEACNGGEKQDGVETYQ